MRTTSQFQFLARDHRQQWAEAKCVNQWELFFADDGQSGAESVRNTRKARQLCASCPLLATCKEEYRDEEYGIFFGTTTQDRQRRQRLKRMFLS